MSALTSTLGALLMLIVGAALAAVTVFGLVSSQVDSHASHPGNTANPTISYGTN